MDPPVSDKDKAAYDAAMTKTAEILYGIQLALKQPVIDAPPALGEAPSPDLPAPPPPAPAAPAPPPEAPGKIVFNAADTVGRFAQSAPPPPPAAGNELRSTHDFERHAGPVPAGGIKIVSRSGTSTPTSTLEQMIDATEDPQQKALLVSIKDAVDAPDGTWLAVKNALAELWWANRDAVSKLLPLILRR